MNNLWNFSFENLHDCDCVCLGSREGKTVLVLAYIMYR